MNRYTFRLYVTGGSLLSEKAIANLRRICNQALRDDCHVTIVDVLEQPNLAEEDRILATPTLIRVSPKPTRRVIGDLSDLSRVLASLGIEPSPDLT